MNAKDKNELKELVIYLRAQESNADKEMQPMFANWIRIIKQSAEKEAK